MPNIVTEDEAKRMWCPDARVHTSDGCINRSLNTGGPAIGSLCLGSKCMAWRWFNPDPATRPEAGASGWCGRAASPWT